MNNDRAVTPLVSAIVSTYNAERFIRGKLADLEAQSIAQDLEIIVIDSGSQQNERAIVEEFQRRYPNIRYIRTEQRETVYQAWNRGIRAARGEFVTNANTDDRLRRDCYEILVRTLREHPECVLAYPDMRITEEPNATFESHRPLGFRDWPDFDRTSLMELCCVGPFPLWRRALHNEIGYFDERYKSAADYEFWLRAALQHAFIHVPQFLGLYWLSEDTVSRKGDLPALEYMEVQRLYRAKYAPFAPAPAVLPPLEEARYLAIVGQAPTIEQAIQELKGFVKLHPQWPTAHLELAQLCYKSGDAGFARKHFEKAVLLEPENAVYHEYFLAFLRSELYGCLKHHAVEAAHQPDDLEIQLTLGMICILMERFEAARTHYQRALEIAPQSALARENLAFLGRQQAKAEPGAPSYDGFNRAELQRLTSIVIVTCNQLEVTKECLESIERNTPEPHEMILVDNGSTDGTLAWLKELCAGKSGYRIIENCENVGFAAGCNIGMKAAKGEHILLLNNAVVVTPGWLGGMLECLEREPSAAIVGPMTNAVPGIQSVAATIYRNLEELEEYARRFKLDHQGRRLPVDSLAGFCMLFTRKLIDEIGDLDTRFGSGTCAVDDFCLRAALAGWGCVIAGDVFIHDYGSRPSAGNRNNHATAAVKSRAEYDRKWDLSSLEESMARQVVTHNALLNGERLTRQGRLNQAVDLLLQEGIGMSPESHRPYLALARLLNDAGRFQDALDVLSQTPPGEELAKLHLTALAETGLGNLAKATEIVEQGLTQDPQSAPFLSLKGVLAAAKGEASKAEELFRSAMLADPGFGHAFTEMSVLKWGKGRRDEALTLAELGFMLSPLRMHALDRFHGYAIECGALPREEQKVREALSLYPDHKGLTFGLIEILIRSRRYLEAMDEIERAAVEFGLDDGTIDAGLEIRNFAGPRPHVAKGSGAVSLCMIVKNEAHFLPSALLSVKGFADEVIVVDTGSSDRTCDIARLFGARLFSFPWNGSFSDARNFSISKAQGDWILVLDADEVLASCDLPPLAGLLKRTSSPTAFSFVTRNYTEEITRKNWTANSGEYPREERGRGWTPSEKVRLFPNDSRVRFQGEVHELLEVSLLACDIPIIQCDVPVHHYGKLDAPKNAQKQEHYYQLGLKKLNQTGGSVEALTELAVQATELNKLEEAEGLWQRVLQSRPESVDAHFNLGYLHLAKGDYHKAHPYARKAADLAPGMKEASFNLAKCQLFLGQLPEVLARCEEMLATAPDYPPALSLLSVTLLITGRKGDALALIEKLGRMGFDCCDFLTEYAQGLQKGASRHLAAPLLDLADALQGKVPGDLNGRGNYCHA